MEAERDSRESSQREAGAAAAAEQRRSSDVGDWADAADEFPRPEGSNRKAPHSRVGSASHGMASTLGEQDDAPSNANREGAPNMSHA